MKIKNPVVVIGNVIFLLGVLLSATLRILQVRDYNFAFTFDQARDMLEIRPMAQFRDIKLVGPTTSINGLLLGPYYYYFNLLAYWLGNGNPQALANWNVLWFVLSAVIVYIVLKREYFLFALILSLFYLFSPQLFPVTSYFWNANSAVYVALFYFVCLFLFSHTPTPKLAFLLGLTSTILIQFEAAFGAPTFLYSILVLFLIRRDWGLIRMFFFGSLPLFVPQILFDVTHNFNMTKILLGFFNGTNTVLGEKLPFSTIIHSHLASILPMFEGQFVAPYRYGLYVLILSAGFLFAIRKTRRFASTFVGFFLFSFIFYLLVYHHPLKSWYLLGFRVWYLFVTSYALSFAIESFFSIRRPLPLRATIVRIPVVTVVFLGLFLNFYTISLDKLKSISSFYASDDPKNAKNIIRTLDWVYEMADGERFEAYNFVPEVYDYPYQYLFWWYGKERYNYTPLVVSYSITDVPSYTRMAENFINNNGGGQSRYISLIYEMKDGHNSWLEQFKDYCVVKKEIFEWKVAAEWREKCKI
jgi:hypothetical protein